MSLLCCHSDDIRQKMMSKYTSNNEYTFEKVNRASLACGPMVKWAIAQVSGSQILPEGEYPDILDLFLGMKNV